MSAQATNTQHIRQTVICALMTALLCILCPFSVPIGPVPVSLGVFAVYLVSFVLPPFWSVLASALYLLLGTAGLPVFAGYTAGPARLMGPTGGYLVGYLFLSGITAAAVARSFHKSGRHLPSHRVPGLLLQLCGMGAGLVILYLFGSVWYSLYAGVSFSAALSVCVVPFLVFDAVKIICALVVGNALRTGLVRAHLLQGQHLT